MAVERPTQEAPPPGDGRAGDLEAIRLLLRGGSVVDWHHLAFRDQADVERFLRVNEFDPSNERDGQRLDILRQEAVDFLRRIFNFRIPDDVAERVPIQELLLLASRKGKRQMYACIVLKVMHIIHHLAGRELLFRLPISDDEVFHLVERKVVRIVEEIRAAGHAVAEFEWSRKPRDSLILKLMAKKSTLAANVYDKLRFRLVVREERDIVPLLIELTHRLIPFNYIVPGESVNDIVSAAEIGLEEQTPDKPSTRENEFSGPGYRIINFVADMPIRLDEFICRVSDPANLEYGSIVFVLTEFQVVDLKTAQQNEQGEDSHEKYKERQIARVKQRLLRGHEVTTPERPATNKDEDKGD